MEPCTFNNLQAGSRVGMILSILIVAGVAGVAGGFGGWYIGAQSRPGTVIALSVSSNFSVAFNQSGVVLYPANSSYNCSLLLFLAISINANDFDAIMAYMKAHPDYYFGPGNITDVSGIKAFQSGMNEQIITNQMFSFGGTPRNDSKMDGQSKIMDFGNNAILFFFEIGIFVGGTTYETYAFGFEENNDFVSLVSHGKANYDAFSAAKFIRGLDNKLVINSLDVDLDNSTNSLADVMWNGAELLMPFSTI